MGDATREKWDTEKMREHRNDWTLAADIHLFSYMQQFSQNLLSETHSTLKALDSLESDIAKSCVEVSNIGNRFWSLSDTQFVENRVYDDDDIASPPAPTSPQDNFQEDSEAVGIQRLREAIQNGIQVLDSRFEAVQIPASDSDEEDSSPHSGVILKPVNRYRDRRLPHLIGSAEFRSDDTLGLRDAPSDEETEDFMSASDKANESESEESEDSDIESDQTKGQPGSSLPHPYPLPDTKGGLDPRNLRLPGLDGVQAGSNISSPPSGDLFGEPEPGDDLFSQVANKKPMFSSWQPSDLWAPEEEEEKIPHSGEDSSYNRPASENSSISSAQSSNVSEPVKKTSEDFGKSGTGRQAVLVQEDQDDLFRSKAANAPPQTKEFVPAGGVKIFGGDFNPFANRNPPKENLKEDLPSDNDLNRPEKDDEDNSFTKTLSTATKVLPGASAANVFSKKKEMSLFDDEEEDDLFSSRPSEPKTRPKAPSVASSIASIGATRTETEEDDLFSSRPSEPKVMPKAPSVTSNSASFGASRTEAEEDDLFSNASLFSESRTNLSHSLFKDDLFSDESEDLFLPIDKKKQTEKPTKSLGDSLFSDQLPSDKDLESKSKIPPPKRKANLGADLFGDGDDFFGNVSGPKGEDLFSDTPSLTKPASSSVTSKVQANPIASKSIKKDLFDDSDNDDDLFGTSKSSKTSKNPVSQPESLFGSKITAPVKQDAVKDDLFGATTTLADTKQQGVKGKPSVLKGKKGLERRSLFDSDSDDDLFSSPQGSLSSRKSVQSASAPTESSEDSKKSVKDSIQSKLPKTDFSSIFSNDQDETDFKLGSETVSDNIFGEDVDLFSNSNVKTPDLFGDLLSKPVVKPKEDSNPVPKEENSEIKAKSESEVKKSETLIETVNKPVATASKKSTFSDIFSDVPEDNVKPLISKKPEPPKSLNIKPIVDNLKDNVQESEKEKNIDNVQKPIVSKKPSPKVSVEREKPAPSDTSDAEVMSPPSPSKSVPGKLKASQLININTAALLPGARPSKSEPQQSDEAVTEVGPPDSAPAPAAATPAPAPATATPAPAKPAPARAQSSDSVSDMPPKSSLLQSVNKERVKIQSKRRPSSRRARQEALRASSLGTDAAAGVDGGADEPGGAPPSSALMSPSTDEEDLFGVPPLDVVYDVKTVSPSTDIFGTPTVLSPVTNKQLPSSFVSTPFVHSQPPPLDEEQEEGNNQDEDLFGSQSNLLGGLVEKKPQRVEQEPPRKGVTEDIFSDVEDDRLFRGIKEAPPPLLDDDDDDDEYDDLFMTRKKKENPATKISYSGSVITALESFPKEDSSTKLPHSNKSVSDVSSIAPAKSQELSDDSLFSSKSSTIGNSTSLFSEIKNTNEVDSEDFLFNESAKLSSDITEASLFPVGTSLKKPADSSSEVSGHEKVPKRDPLFSNIEDDDSFLFAKPNMKSNELFSASEETDSGNVPAKTETKEKKNTSDDELFGSDFKTSQIKSSTSSTVVADKPKSVAKPEDVKQPKKGALFGEEEDEDVGNLFSSDKKMKAKPSVKSSLFGDEDDDDDIFGSLSSNKRTEIKSVPSASGTVKGVSSKTVKTGSSGSTKPVKLETKQTFSDPLLSHDDQ